MNDILALTAAAAFVSLCGVAVSVVRLVRRVRSQELGIKAVNPKDLGRTMVVQGGVLSDHQIREAVLSGQLLIDPFEPSLVTPGSLDIRLGHEVVVFDDEAPLPPMLDPGSIQEILSRGKPITITWAQPYKLTQDGFVLAQALERIELGPEICGFLNGRSRWAMIGLNVSSAEAGFIQPGWGGRPIFGITTHLRGGVLLVPEMPIAQLVFQWMASEPHRPHTHSEIGANG